MGYIDIGAERDDSVREDSTRDNYLPYDIKGQLLTFLVPERGLGSLYRRHDCPRPSICHPVQNSWYPGVKMG